LSAPTPASSKLTAVRVCSKLDSGRLDRSVSGFRRFRVELSGSGGFFSDGCGARYFFVGLFGFAELSCTDS
jgi:hypothetical protein